MTARAVDQKLSAHPFVFGMSAQDVGLLADCSMLVDFPKRETIFRQGEEANRVYLIEAGAVAMESMVGSRRIVTEMVHGGELLGLSWLFPPHKWRVTARACEPTSAIALNGALLRKYAEKDDTLGFQLHKRFAEVMAQRFQLMRRRFLESLTGTVEPPPCE
jgi:CRP/FNR family cyclic AMP-dependent transcriptional regulator